VRNVPRKAPLYGIAAAFIGIATGAAVLHALKASGYQVIANVTSSAPVGFYWLDANSDNVTRGDYILVDMPEPYAALVYGRGYAKQGEPLLKRVAGLPGDTVCTTPLSGTENADVYINGRRYGTAFGRDFAGRKLPYKIGCYKVKFGYVVPMNNHIVRSFDGRYFGQVPDSYVVGKVRKLWTY
jgi:conjugative transfer signal peptidase TraF